MPHVMNPYRRWVTRVGFVDREKDAPSRAAFAPVEQLPHDSSGEADAFRGDHTPLRISRQASYRIEKALPPVAGHLRPT